METSYRTCHTLSFPDSEEIAFLFFFYLHRVIIDLMVKENGLHKKTGLSHNQTSD